MKRARPVAALLVPAILAVSFLPAASGGSELDRYLATNRIEQRGGDTRAVPEEKARDPKTAFLLSLLVPGAGEYYAGARYRALGFFAAEALSWIAWSSWRSKGADLRDDFRAYADQNWSEARYIEWETLNRSMGMPYPETHGLPSKTEDTQQYYELIGKYNQFVYGWSDVTTPLSVDEAVVSQIRSDRRIDYENQRNESNKYLKRASVIIGVTVMNHLVSAIHASAYVRSQNPSQAEKRIWVNVMPVSDRGKPRLSAALSARF